MAPVRGAQTPGMAKASFILGLLSALLYSCGGPLLAILSIIFGVIALLKVKKSPDRFKGAWLAKGGVALSCLSLIAAAAVAVKMREIIEREGGATGDRVKTKFELAEDSIRSMRGDQIGFGNTEHAKELAAALGERMKVLRDAAFSSKAKSEFSLSGGEFLTHCEMTENTCAFIVHVPQFRKFDDKAKVALNDIAWVVAQSLLANTEFPEGGELAVGLKGIALYDDIRIGQHVKEWPDEEEKPGLKRRGLESRELKRFFPEPKPVPVEEASEKETNAQPQSQTPNQS